MKRIYLPTLLFVPALLLAGCRTQAAVVLPGTPSTSPSPAPMACTVFHGQATAEALAAEFSGHAHVSGRADAPVTLVFFSDYQCPSCALQAVILRELRQTHPDDLRLVFLHAPRTDQDKDLLAIQAVEAADLQGMFWQMSDRLFETLSDWSGMSPQSFPGWAAGQAAALGMDRERFQADFSGPEVQARVGQAVSETAGLAALGRPILYINSNTPYSGLADLASLDTVIRLEALSARQFSACPPWVIDPVRQYIATLETDGGPVTLQLFPDKAPLAVNNFVYLARQGWFDDTTFFQVIPALKVEAGDPSGTGFGNPGYYFEVEFPANVRFDRPGMLAMDNRGYGTNGSQFFITLAPAPNLDGQYTIFGQVLDGLELLQALGERDPQPGALLPAGETLLQVTIEER